METLGIVTGGHDQCGCGVGTDAEEAEQIGDGGDKQCFDPLVELGELVIERTDPVRQRRQGRLGGRRHRIRRARRPQLGPLGDEGRNGKPFEATTELLRCAVAEVAHLDEGLDPGLAGRALCDHEDPDGLDGAVSRLRAAARSTTQSRSGGLDCIEGIGLATATALLSVGSVDLDDLDADSAQVTRQSRSISLDPPIEALI